MPLRLFWQRWFVAQKKSHEMFREPIFCRFSRRDVGYEPSILQDSEHFIRLRMLFVMIHEEPVSVENPSFFLEDAIPQKRVLR